MAAVAVTVVLVHGAWGGAWSWARVSYKLRRLGIATAVVDLPSRGPDGGLAADVAAVRGAAAGPVVLVGHSYGGMVITEAAGGVEVAHLVYVCAPMPLRGQTVHGLMASDPVPSRLPELLRWQDDGTATVDPAGARTEFFGDASDVVVAPVLPALGRHLMSTFDEPATVAGWEGVPSTYVVGRQDRVLSPALQREMAANADHTVELDAAHCPMLTRPDRLVELIVEVAA